MPLTCPSDHGEGPSTVSRVVPFPVADQWRAASVAQRSFAELGRPRVNVLFIGADEAISGMLASTLELAAPLATWRPGEPMHLPENASVRTLFIRDVGEMSGAEQIRLLEWLARVVGRTQVICTSRFPLIPLVEDGRFINTLYYRLNTVCLDLTTEG